MTLVNLGNNKVKVEKLGLKQGVSLMLIYLSMIELDEDKNKLEQLYTTYKQRALSYGEIILDTENIEIETTEIGNQKVTLFINKGVNQIYWDDSYYSYTLISSINKDEIIEMARSILEKNKKILNMCHKSPHLFVNNSKNEIKGDDFFD